jgi:hypothetical protein
MRNDDGTTYAYENGKDAISTLHWDEKNRQLTHSGATAWVNDIVVRIVGQ